MNREFNPTSKLVRAVLAAGSLVISIIVVGSVSSLADHYSAESQLVNAQRLVTAQR